MTTTEGASAEGRSSSGFDLTKGYLPLAVVLGVIGTATGSAVGLFRQMSKLDTSIELMRRDVSTEQIQLRTDIQLGMNGLEHQIERLADRVTLLERSKP